MVSPLTVTLPWLTAVCALRAAASAADAGGVLSASFGGLSAKAEMAPEAKIRDIRSNSRFTVKSSDWLETPAFRGSVAIVKTRADREGFPARRAILRSRRIGVKSKKDERPRRSNDSVTSAT
jgi:hypothetical protein